MATQGNDERLKVPGQVRPGGPISAREENMVRRALQVVDAELRRRTPRPSASHGVKRGAGGFSVFHKGGARERGQVAGFTPVARGLGDSGTETPGVGLVEGPVMLVGGLGAAVRYVPTLEGSELDTDPRPRKALAAGDWEAWITGTGGAAQVEFVASGDPEPSSNDWQVLVAIFTVTLPPPADPQIPTVSDVTQYLHGELVMPKRDFTIRLKADGDIEVGAGRVRTANLRPDSASDAVWTLTPVIVTKHTFTPADSKTYGIWLEVPLVSSSGNNPPQHGDAGDLDMDSPSTGIIIKEDENEQEAADAKDLVLAATGTAYVYLGKVAVDGAGAVTITQAMDGPIDLPAPTYLTNLVSLDSNNDLATGTDRGLYVRLLSDAAGNQLSQDANGLTYEGVTKIIDGTGISISPADGIGNVTVTNDNP